MSRRVTVHEATLADTSILRRLMQLYQYDFSEIEETDLDEHGVFAYRYLDHYWTEPGRHPFLVRADGQLAGFALVNAHTYLDDTDQSLAEFFILRRYRRAGVGRSAAFEVFSQFSGLWEVRVTEANHTAQSFWHSVISAYIDSEPVVHRHPQWEGVMFQFASS